MVGAVVCSGVVVGSCGVVSGSGMVGSVVGVSSRCFLVGGIDIDVSGGNKVSGSGRALSQTVRLVNRNKNCLVLIAID